MPMVKSVKRWKLIMKQTISKNGVVICVTTVPYEPNIVKDMKKAGYKIKTEDNK
jgi:hypothetical protein